MPTKAELYAQMADKVATQLTGSWQEWAGFLTTASRLYKYPFHEQLMIYAQRPDATACAEYDLWNERMGRYVRRGSKGIALVDDSGDRPRLRYVFDISDTGTREHSRTPWLWQLEERHLDSVQAMRRCDNMNTNDLNTALFEKMAAEQDKFRDWLKSQPPEEVLNHAYEYTIREDIVMAMEELELIDTQAQALLESPSPLADVYRYFEKLETGYMDVIRDSIENRADDVCRAQEELRTAPLYPHSAAYASEHGEMAQYNRSYQANSACKEAIEQAISAHYAANRLDTEAAVKDVLEKFGAERVQFILTNTIQHKNHDGRISQDNKAWAKTIPMPEDSGASRHCAYLVVDGVNPGLTDLFTRQARKAMQEQQKSSVLQKLRQEPPARKPAAPKKQEPER